VFFFSSRRRHTRFSRDWSSDVCSSDLMPYSPIHDDDICAQLEPLLGVASVPATIVNWCGDEAVSVQQWSAYFAELLGVEHEVERSEERRVGKECRSRWSADETAGPSRP